MLASMCDYGGIDYTICTHSRQGLGSLVVGAQFNDAIGQLRQPSTQYADLGLFIGRTRKSNFINNYLATSSMPRSKSTINLTLDDRTKATKHPLYILDVEHCSDGGIYKHAKQCHACQEKPILWDSPCKGTVIDNLVARVLLPNASVVCVFADDCGGIKGIVHMIDSLLRLGTYSQIPRGPLPELIIFGENDPDMAQYVGKLQSNQALKELFSAVKLLSSSSRVPARRVIIASVKQHRELRLAANMLFVAKHQITLLMLALQHFRRTTQEPFDICRASVPQKLLAGQFLRRMEYAFVTEPGNYKIPKLDIYEVVASALLFATPAHRLPPGEYFDRVLRTSLVQRLTTVFTDQDEISIATDFIGHRFVSLSSAIIPGRTTTSVYRFNVSENTRAWSGLRSAMTCLCCLDLPPEHILCCGHGFCETCLRIFGRDGSTVSTCFDTLILDVCMVCGQRCDMQIRLKPPTGGIRVLSIDGGGIKGVVPLEILRQMQGLVGADCDVRDLFDLCIGTSAGGLVALKIFLQGASIDHASIAFKDLSRKIFQSSKQGQHNFLSTLARIVKSVSKDELYDSALLDKMLIDQFGTGHILGYNANSFRGTRVGVVATAVCKDTSAPARIFSNYNGIGSRSSGAGYRLQRSEDCGKEALIWQAARATSAAPGFFRPAMTSYGAFMDGCMCHNNPVNIALWESRVLWPHNRKPDVVVSLGTGSKLASPSPTISSPKLSLRDAFPFRVAQTFWSSMDGQVAWRDLMNTLDETAKKNFFRLSVEYTGHDPALDDETAIEPLIETVRTQPGGEAQQREVLTALLISSFYLELDPGLKRQHGRLLLTGRLKCRVPNATRALERLCSHELELFDGDVSLNEVLSMDDVCATCARYSKKLNFSFKSMDDSISLCVKWNNASNCRNIGAMPQTVSWFLQAQGLDDVFARTPASQTEESICRACVRRSPKRQSRSRDSEVPARVQKRQRL